MELRFVQMRDYSNMNVSAAQPARRGRIGTNLENSYRVAQHRNNMNSIYVFIIVQHFPSMY